MITMKRWYLLVMKQYLLQYWKDWGQAKSCWIHPCCWRYKYSSTLHQLSICSNLAARKDSLTMHHASQSKNQECSRMSRTSAPIHQVQDCLPHVCHSSAHGRELAATPQGSPPHGGWLLRVVQQGSQWGHRDPFHPSHWGEYVYGS